MNRITLALVAAAALLVAGCGKGVDEKKKSGPKSDARTVSVGTQPGPLTAGKAGSVEFEVTTANIPDDAYEVTVENLPAGVSVGSVVTPDKIFVTGNRATLLLRCNNSVTEGVYTSLTLSITGQDVTSRPFTLTIGPAQAAANTISVGAKTSEQWASGYVYVDFAVTVKGFPDRKYDEMELSFRNKPSGLTSYYGITISGGTGTMTLQYPVSLTAGSYTMQMSLDGTTWSNEFTVVVTAPSVKTITVGAQQGPMTAGQESYVDYAVTTRNIGAGNYLDGVDMSVANRPAGVTVVQGITIGSDGKGTLRLRGNGNQTEGTRSDLTLTIGGTTSEAFSLTVDPANIPVTAIAWAAGSGGISDVPQGLNTNYGVAFTPGNATDKRVKWSSSHPALVSFDYGEAGEVFDTEGQKGNRNRIRVSKTAAVNTVITVTVTSVARPTVKHDWKITVKPAQTRSVTVEDVVSGRLKEWTAGEVIYTVKCTGFPLGDSFPASLVGAPAGLSLRDSRTEVTGQWMGNNFFSLVLVSDKTLRYGTYKVRLNMDGVLSDEFEVFVGTDS